MKNVTFIGLGVMGYPMAGHLTDEAKYNVTVFNRTGDIAAKWEAEFGGRSAGSIATAVKEADVVLTCVGADRDLEEIYCGEDGIIANAPKGAILIDHTTASASIAEYLAREAQRNGQSFLDAPVSGGQQGAVNGALTVMCGGDEAVFERVRPLLDEYSKAVTYMGGAGAGQLTKMVNQITVAGLLQGLSEGLHFAERAGLDPRKVVDVISKGAAQSWQMDNRAETMIRGEYNHGFAVEWMRKDLAICISEARQRGATLPAAAMIDQFYSDVEAMGGSRWDTSSLLERLRALHKPAK
ncbi:NAD(P)-dependent oxidoreductase [Marinobacteraceae bacterium S3BR75-40.1]